MARNERGTPADHGPLAGTPGRTVVVVDGSVEDAAVLARGMADRAEVHLLDPAGDPMDRIADILAAGRGVAALHVVSHGAEGRVLLGDTVLSAAGLDGHAEALAAWGDALAPGGEILLYGCRAGAGAAGRALVDGLARLTGAAVAASDDDTGNGTDGAPRDWVLEVSSGPVRAAPFAVDAYAHALATITVDTNVDASSPGGGATTLRDAIAEASDGDTIVFDAGLSGQTITLDADLGHLLIDKSLTIDGDIDGNGSADITLSGDLASRVLFVTGEEGARSDVILADLMLDNGLAQGGGGGKAGGGGGLGAGGAIFVDSFGDLTLRDVTVSDYSAVGGDGGAGGQESTGGGGGGGLGGDGGAGDDDEEGPDGGGGGGGVLPTDDGDPPQNDEPNTSAGTPGAGAGGGGDGGTAFGGAGSAGGDFGGGGGGGDDGQGFGDLSDPPTEARFGGAGGAGGFGGGGGGGGNADSTDGTGAGGNGGLGGFGAGGGGGGLGRLSVEFDGPPGTGAAGGLGGGAGVDGGNAAATDVKGGGGGGGAGLGGAIFVRENGSLTIEDTAAGTRALGTDGSVTAGEGGDDLAGDGEAAGEFLFLHGSGTTVTFDIGDGAVRTIGGDAAHGSISDESDLTGGTNGGALVKTGAGTLEVENLTLNDATVEAGTLQATGTIATLTGSGGSLGFSLTSSPDPLTVTQSVTLSGSGLSVDLAGGYTPSLGNEIIIVDNTGGSAVSGTFAGLAEGAQIVVDDGLAFAVSYVGGDGNDIVLTAEEPNPNAAPELGGTFTTAGTVDDDSTLQPFQQVTVSDAEGDSVSLTIAFTGANGELSAPGDPAWLTRNDAGSFTLEVTDVATQTSRLQSLVFTPTANQVAAGVTVQTTFTVTPADTQPGVADSTTVVTATSVNDAPTVTSDATATVAENDTGTVYTVTATDPDPDAVLGYAISGGADAGLFEIDAATGAVTFASAPDFEEPSDAGGDNVYDIMVTASDGTLTSTPQAVAIAVTDQSPEPPVFTSGTTASVAENTTAAYTAAATNPEDGAPPTYSIEGGADAGKFSIDGATGAVSFVQAPDFESPTDSGGDNVYDVTIRATIGNVTADQAVAITVTDANESPTVTSGATASTEENATGTVYTVTGSDPDAGATLTFAIAGGADASLFEIDAETGAVTFASAPDFEAPSDAGGDNVYDITVTVSDGTNTSDPQAVAITVTDQSPEPPAFTSGTTASVAENTTAAYTAAAVNPEGGAAPTYSIEGGADAGKFSIDGATGAVSFIQAPDFESPTDSGGDNVYDVTIRATIGNVTADQAVAITVTDANESPTVTSGATASTEENATGTVYTVTGSDPDAGATLTFAIAGGADAHLFEIDAETGAVTFADAPDFEAPSDAGGDNVYDITVTASDGTNTTDPQAVAITVTDGNDAPAIGDLDGDAITYDRSGEPNVIDSGDAATLSDADTTDFNQGSLTVTIASGEDPDEDVLTLSGATVVLAGTTDGSEITIDGDTVAALVGDIGAGNDLQIEFGDSATTAHVQTVLRALAYRNDDSGDPTTGARTLLVTVTDPDDGTSSATVTVTVPENTAPTVTGVPTDVTVIQGVASDIDLSAIAFADDDDDSLTVTLAASGGRLVASTVGGVTVGGSDTGTLTLSGTAAALNGFLDTSSSISYTSVGAAVGDNAATFTISASDGIEGLASDPTVNIDIQAPPPPPDNGGTSGTSGTVGTPTPTTSTIVVTPITPTTTTSTGTSTAATITNTGTVAGSAAIVENSGNNGNLVTATLPPSTSIVSEGPTQAQTGADAVSSLVTSIQARGSTGEAGLVSGAQTFLGHLAATTTLDVRTIVPTTTASSLTDPIVITGTGDTGQSEAFVIDVRGLPSGSTLQLDNIEFASIVGSATVNGGAGDNYAVGDDASQFISLGEGTDTLFGGAGDDTIGSAGGDDALYGDEGNDLVMGGIGNDTVSGGTGNDTLSGGEGDDVMAGGTGRDVAAFGIGHDVAWIEDDRTNGTVAGEGTDTVDDAEILAFADRTTMVTQDAVAVDEIDESFYLAVNPEVAAAVESGQFASGAEHYALFGRAEGRVADDLTFDQAYYLEVNPDVAAAGWNALEHYLTWGFVEGRTGYLTDDAVI